MAVTQPGVLVDVNTKKQNKTIKTKRLSSAVDGGAQRVL